MLLRTCLTDVKTCGLPPVFRTLTPFHSLCFSLCVRSDRLCSLLQRIVASQTGWPDEKPSEGDRTYSVQYILQNRDILCLTVFFGTRDTYLCHRVRLRCRETGWTGKNTLYFGNGQTKKLWLESNYKKTLGITMRTKSERETSKQRHYETQIKTGDKRKIGTI